MGECKTCGALIDHGEVCEKCQQERAYIDQRNNESMFTYEDQHPTYDPPKKPQSFFKTEQPTAVDQQPTTKNDQPIIEETSEDPFLVQTDEQRPVLKRSKWLIFTFFFVVAAAALVIYTEVQSKDALYFTVNEKKQLGFVNAAGEMVIEPQFDSAYPLQTVQNTSGVRGKGPEHMMEAFFFTGALYPIHEDGQYGYINRQGEWVIEPKYDQAFSLHDGRALVVKVGGHGYINSQGAEVIPTKFRDAKSFKDGLAPVYVEDQWGYINKNGQIVIEPQFEAAFHFNDGLALVRDGEGFTYINRDGEYEMDEHYEHAFGYAENRAPVLKGGKYGFINRAGEMVIEPQYDRAFPFREGVATVCNGEQCGTIGKSGNVIIEQKFRDISWYVDGLASASADNKRGYINKNGNFDIPIKGNYVTTLPYYGPLALAVVEMQNPSRGAGLQYRMQYINQNGEIVHEFKPF